MEFVQTSGASAKNLAQKKSLNNYLPIAFALQLRLAIFARARKTAPSCKCPLYTNARPV